MTDLLDNQAHKGLVRPPRSWNWFLHSSLLPG